MAVAKVKGVVAAVELVPVQDRFELCRIGPVDRVERAHASASVGLGLRRATWGELKKDIHQRVHEGKLLKPWREP